MRSVRYCAVILAVLTPSLASATTADLTQRRQEVIGQLLSSAPLSRVTAIRATCVTGGQPASISRDRGLGLVELPDASDYCVTAATRIGRAGQLGYLRDTRYTTVTPALALDNGFVTAFLKHETIPASLPTMAALKPVAERCLSQAERDADLCYSVGYAYGVRAADGEIVHVQ